MLEGRIRASLFLEVFDLDQVFFLEGENRLIPPQLCLGGLPAHSELERELRLPGVPMAMVSLIDSYLVYLSRAGNETGNFIYRRLLFISA